ncbi:hypothetical protein FIBSPDRAFT_1055419 [Athelia psychrophila]|uniref:Uncharacterized protein n=1 Tax=Athelia psychrophila TaxID=1759441 RepID=A0A167TRE5_9AGAM|nr:hypothetical protein FIBSPDRAFT_1055419 [Fibularhizoctonia sp. CBS 109695]
MGKVHGSLARAGKVKSQTPKVEAQEKKKTPKGRAKKRILYNRRFVNVTLLPGGKRKIFVDVTDTAARQTEKDVNANSPPSHPPRQHFNVMLRAPIAASTSTGLDAVVGILETIASNAIDATRPGAAPSRLAYSPSACPPPCVRTTALIEVPTIVALGLHPHSTP